MFLSFTRVKCRWRLKPFFSSATFSTPTIPLMLICLRFSWSVRGVAMLLVGQVRIFVLWFPAGSEAESEGGVSFSCSSLLLQLCFIGACRGRVFPLLSCRVERQEKLHRETTEWKLKGNSTKFPQQSGVILHVWKSVMTQVHPGKIFLSIIYAKFHIRRSVNYIYSNYFHSFHSVGMCSGSSIHCSVGSQPCFSFVRWLRAIVVCEWETKFRALWIKAPYKCPPVALIKKRRIPSGMYVMLCRRISAGGPPRVEWVQHNTEEILEPDATRRKSVTWRKNLRRQNKKCLGPASEQEPRYRKMSHLLSQNIFRNPNQNFFNLHSPCHACICV